MIRRIVFAMLMAVALAVAGSVQTFAQSCPPHSHADVSSSGGNATANCVCDVGYVQYGGACMPEDTD